MRREKANLTSRNIKDFDENDTVYISKMKSGFRYTYLCKFVSFKKGIVTGVAVETDRDYNDGEIGTTISARLDRCYLWGQTAEKGDWARCHWFEKGGAAR